MKSAEMFVKVAPMSVSLRSTDFHVNVTVVLKKRSELFMTPGVSKKLLFR